MTKEQKAIQIIKDKKVNTYFDITMTDNFVDYVLKMEALVCQRPYLTKEEFKLLKELF